MYDEAEERGDTFSVKQLSRLLGVPMVPTVFTSGRGVEELFHTVISLHESMEGDHPDSRHIHINHGRRDRERHPRYAGAPQAGGRPAQALLHPLPRYQTSGARQGGREMSPTMPDAKEIFAHRDHAAARDEPSTRRGQRDGSSLDAKYGLIHGALEEGTLPRQARRRTLIRQPTSSTTSSPTSISDSPSSSFCCWSSSPPHSSSASIRWSGWRLVWPGSVISPAVPFPRGPSATCSSMASSGVWGAVIVFPPPDSHPLLLHLVHGGLRLHGARRFHHG